ncbi:putative membrane protein [Arthrobacter sp. CAN_A212]|uniref:DUF1622 domain-containing protein n=1 Tax=unclassified Arthrobacter TaxID=235627 RepID=UPI0018CA270F|nr:DUF1622 domain-containing protein [Arthrobacter sp. CAN_C5]MBP2217616.1 putative membrane protein [Arthrobacter sp. CAN_C5]
MDLQNVVEIIGTGIEVAGVLVIVAGMLVATLLAAAALMKRKERDIYDTYRRRLGRSILLGLEFLVAGDIIRTVAVTPTFYSVGVLALIVLIRTFLSFSLELEITGKWPWQKSSFNKHAMKQSPPPTTFH